MPFHPGTHGPEYPYAGRSELDENEEVTGLSSFYHLDDDDVFYLEQGDFPSMFDSDREGKAFVQTIARIPDVEIHPLPSDHLRIATQPIDPQYFIARPRLYRYGPEQRGTTRIADMFLDLVYAHENWLRIPTPTSSSTTAASSSEGVSSASSSTGTPLAWMQRYFKAPSD
ncbi:hypothetical protein C1H76_3181 [Elsinoe australis]|uniref:Uncharacterized protein n=1 Tax=Elsinoe australis TaxID=40998 RepID=A0A4V6DUP8_9PEZI|nr:hypothetical protein C1H76_3181 [Elsinoe australis]